MTTHDSKRSSRLPMPADVDRELACAMAPVAPGAERAAKMKERLLTRVRRESQRFVTVRRDDGVWQPFAPSVSIKLIDSDPAMESFLLRLDPGGRLPGHAHADDELCVVLEGEVTLGDVTVGAGDYHMALAGSDHGEITSRTGCVLFIRTGGGASGRRAASARR